MIVNRIVQSFGEITGHLRLGVLIVFYRFAAIEPGVSNIIEVFVADTLEGSGLKREHRLFNDILVQCSLP